LQSRTILQSKTIHLMEIYDLLLDRYGDPHWWPAESPYEVITGAILTQNTAWGNVEKAVLQQLPTYKYLCSIRSQPDCLTF